MGHGCQERPTGLPGVTGYMPRHYVEGMPYSPIRRPMPAPHPIEELQVLTQRMAINHCKLGVLELKVYLAELRIIENHPLVVAAFGPRP